MYAIRSYYDKETWYYISIAGENSYGIGNFTTYSTFKTTSGEIPYVELLAPANLSTAASFDFLEWQTTATSGTISYVITSYSIHYTKLYDWKNRRAIQQDFLLTFSKDFSDFNLTINGGGASEYYINMQQGTTITGLAIPNFFSLNNAKYPEETSAVV